MSRDRETEGRAKGRGALEEDFASRWSRMKRGARGSPVAGPDAEAQPPADERNDEEILRELGLPDPETLKPGDDVKGFMASAVPARIRNRVLRRLWISNPVLSNLDGLVDYGEDFTDAAMVPAVLQTAYKVGRGWARDAVDEGSEGASAGHEREAGETEPEVAETDDPETRLEQAVKEPNPDAATAEDDGGVGDAHQACLEEEVVPVVAQDVVGAEEHFARAANAGSDPARRPAPRRMRFRFSDD